VKVGGLLLAGGRSRRFGSEKAIAPLGDGMMMDVPLGVLREVCIAVAVSVRSGSGAEARAQAMSLACLQDDPEEADGPLAGIRRGLSWASDQGFDWLAVAPCDAPTVTAAHYRALIDAVQRGASAAFGLGLAGPEPLVSVWPVATGYAAVDAALSGGDHPAIRRVLVDIGAVPVALAGYDGRNVNTPADLPCCLPSS
jgi:molybdopterin-guanine dinucleotide biosynthesis protein A